MKMARYCAMSRSGKRPATSCFSASLVSSGIDFGNKQRILLASRIQDTSFEYLLTGCDYLLQGKSIGDSIETIRIQ